MVKKEIVEELVELQRRIDATGGSTNWTPG